jgi:hypothetical protein
MSPAMSAWLWDPVTDVDVVPHGTVSHILLRGEYSAGPVGEGCVGLLQTRFAEWRQVAGFAAA